MNENQGPEVSEPRVVDCEYLRPRFAAAFLLIEGDRAAFIDNNTEHSVPLLLNALREAGRTPEEVDYVIITHVHLDHSGGTAALMKACPNAVLLAHPKAAPHMIDPTRLIEGARRVYGAERFSELYGVIEAVDASRVRVMEDESVLSWGSRSLKFLHTRGHANHHFCILDDDKIYTGDSFGLAYPDLQAQGLFVFPSTSPSDFDPFEAFKSIDRIQSSGASSAFLTHFGKIGDLSGAAEQLKSWIQWSDGLLQTAVSGTQSDETLESFCQTEVLLEMKRRLKARGILWNSDVEELLKLDLDLNGAGIAVTARKRRAKLTPTQG
ncbi:MAG: MBL fold metallo-hydrolase [Methylotenera sp.]|nr:MBL fold metallo-hydrolase [Oligoflexia bacterium]